MKKTTNLLFLLLLASLGSYAQIELNPSSAYRLNVKSTTSGTDTWGIFGTTSTSNTSMVFKSGISDVSNWQGTGTITGTLGYNGVNTMGMYLASYDRNLGLYGVQGIYFGTSGTYSMLLDNFGHLGLNTNTASATLDIVKGTISTASAASFKGTNFASLFDYSSAEDTYIRGGKATSVVNIGDVNAGVTIGNTTSGLSVGIGGAASAYDFEFHPKSSSHFAHYNANNSHHWEQYVTLGGDLQFFGDNIYKMNLSTSLGLTVNDYTQLGSNAPAVKMLKFTGTTGATQGGNTTIVHGLTASKILLVSIVVDLGGAGNVTENYTQTPGYQVGTSFEGTNIYVWNSPTNSVNILNKPFKVLVTYEQ